MTCLRTPHNGFMLYLYCVLFILFLQAADYNMTLSVLATPGGFEANPIVAMVGVGVSKLIASILGISVGFVCWAYNMSRWMLVFTASIAVVYVPVLLWSLFLLL